MIEERFHRDAESFTWEMSEPVHAGELGFAPERIAPGRIDKFLERQAAALRARPDIRPHLGG